MLTGVSRSQRYLGLYIQGSHVGPVAEWLGTALQKPLHQFDPGWDLLINLFYGTSYY